MVAKHHFTRIDTLELKALIYRKIGYERADKYFNQLTQFFSLKLSKNEFDKFCIRTIGRENISIHNQLIRSIIKNVNLAKVPPLKVRKGSLNVKVGNQRKCFQSVYGDTFPQSPRKVRSPINRDRKFRDRPSPLGPLGKSPSIITCATELHSLGSRPPVTSVEDGEEVEQFTGSPGIQSRSSITAPFGISMNAGFTRKSLFTGSLYDFHRESCMNSGELPDTRSLRSRVRRKLEMDGLSMSMDCANLLNNGLDVFLKRLIGSCIQLAGSRCGKQHLGENGQIIHGSMLDFRVAMESNPRILGEDWPIQLEKICARAYEE